MASIFWLYFRDVLRWPLLFRRGPLSALVEGMARVFDDVREDILWLRDQLNPATCEIGYVEGLAVGRGIERHPLESDEQFRRRSVAAYAWHRQAGKVQGMPRLLAHFGFDGAVVENMRLEDPARWAEFKVRLTPGQVTDDSLSLLGWAINEHKPARSKLAAVVVPYPQTANASIAGAGRVPLRISGGLHYEPRLVIGKVRPIGAVRMYPAISGRPAIPESIIGETTRRAIGAGRILKTINGTYRGNDNE